MTFSLVHIGKQCATFIIFLTSTSIEKYDRIVSTPGEVHCVLSTSIDLLKLIDNNNDIHILHYPGFRQTMLEQVK
jgi:hypothetical protein